MSLHPPAKAFQQDFVIFSAVSRWFCFLAIMQLRAVSSKLLVSALHSCLSVKSSSSKCSFMTSIQVSIQTLPLHHVNVPVDHLFLWFDALENPSDRLSSSLIRVIPVCGITSPSRIWVSHRSFVQDGCAVSRASSDIRWTPRPVYPGGVAG